MSPENFIKKELTNHFQNYTNNYSDLNYENIKYRILMNLLHSISDNENISEQYVKSILQNEYIKNSNFNKINEIINFNPEISIKFQPSLTLSFLKFNNEENIDFFKKKLTKQTYKIIENSIKKYNLNEFLNKKEKLNLNVEFQKYFVYFIKETDKDKILECFRKIDSEIYNYLKNNKDINQEYMKMLIEPDIKGSFNCLDVKENIVSSKLYFPNNFEIIEFDNFEYFNEEWLKELKWVFEKTLKKIKENKDFAFSITKNYGIYNYEDENVILNTINKLSKNLTLFNKKFNYDINYVNVSLFLEEIFENKKEEIIKNLVEKIKLIDSKIINLKILKNKENFLKNKINNSLLHSG